MPITKTYTVYLFSELSEDAQQTALNDNRTVLVEDDSWYDNTIDNWKEKLKELGYTEPDINFSGFGSQGDGASFTSPIDLAMWLKAKKLGNKHRAILNYEKEYSFEFEVRRITHQYYHYNTVMVEHHDGNYPAEWTQEVGDIEKAISKEVVDLCRQIYRDLQNEYFHLTSDECLKDFFATQECTFTQDGGSKIYV